ncbi:hypothetical protein ACN6LM_002581 [Streptomyces sp. SAS_281]|uniref:hypothetical protein n=1 Tax=Streptomyces sp. SAS_281 TaxID=3412744 RepID=UPI00403C76CB
MITQGVQVTSRCAACGGVLVRDVGQFTERGQLRWGIEGRCQKCPEGWCETGTGPAPQEVRQALLAEHGAVRLRLADKGGSLVPVLRALREMNGLSLGEARLAAADLSGEGLIGTFVEMTLLAQGLERRSVATTLATSPD